MRTPNTAPEPAISLVHFHGTNQSVPMDDINKGNISLKQAAYPNILGVKSNLHNPWKKIYKIGSFLVSI